MAFKSLLDKSFPSLLLTRQKPVWVPEPDDWHSRAEVVREDGKTDSALHRALSWRSWHWLSQDGELHLPSDMSLQHCINVLTLALMNLPDPKARILARKTSESPHPGEWGVLPLAHSLSERLRSTPLPELWEASGCFNSSSARKDRAFRWIRAMALLPEFESQGGRELWRTLASHSGFAEAWLDHQLFCEQYGEVVRLLADPTLFPAGPPAFLKENPRHEPATLDDLGF